MDVSYDIRNYFWKLIIFFDPKVYFELSNMHSMMEIRKK